jgi:hypothetical protein
MEITDEFINKLYEGTYFGPKIDNSVNEKRKHLVRTLKFQTEGYWSGNTSYRIVVDGGFLIDSESGTNKKLTAFGLAFMIQEGAL